MPDPSRTRYRSVQQRLSTYCLLGIALIVGASLSSAAVVRAKLRQANESELRALADVEAARIDRQVSMDGDLLARITADSRIRAAITTGDSLSLDSLLRGEATMIGGPKVLTIVDATGRLFGESGPGSAQRSLTNIDLSFSTDRRPQVGGAFLASPGDGRYLQVAPVGDSILGVRAFLLAEFSMEPLEVIVADTARGDTTLDVHLVQLSNNSVQCITDLRFKPGSKYAQTFPLTDDARPAVRAVLGQPALINGATDYRGIRIVADVRKLQSAPWGLVVKKDEREVYQPVRNLLAAVTAVSLVTLAAFLAGYIALIRSLTGRIRALTRSVSALSAGLYDTQVNDQTDDELGRAGRAFDRMAVALARDVARREAVELELGRRAWTDELTSLPNRAMFHHHLTQALDMRQAEFTVAVLFCDLDGFKDVNDQLGHSAGDDLLKSVTIRLKEVLRSTEMLARFGGDEFVVLCSSLTSPSQAEIVAERVRLALREPFRVDKQEVFVTASVGIALADRDSTAESVIRDADTAMYRAKASGRSRHVVVDDNLRATASTRLTERTELQRAIRSGGFTLVYQPIVDLSTKQTVGYEALARWPRDDGVAMPSDFVPLAEELGMAPTLDRWILNRACETIARHPGRFVSVNLSVSTLAVPHLAEEVFSMLARHRLANTSLCLELTETVMGPLGPAQIEQLQLLRQGGVSLAIDDFGIGHSSLARLRQLPFNVLKLDQSFVRDITTDPRALLVCRSIVQLGKDLHIRVVAEGVESREQAEVLVSLGCPSVQGYFFGRPDTVFSSS